MVAWMAHSTEIPSAVQKADMMAYNSEYWMAVWSDTVKAAMMVAKWARKLDIPMESYWVEWWVSHKVAE